MSIKKLLAVVCTAAVCSAFAGCSLSDDKSESSSGETSSEASSAAESSAAEAATDYDVNGDVRAFDKLKETYGDGYMLTFSYESGDVKIDYTSVIKGDRGYEASVNSGMKSYKVLPGDGKAYVVSEATTTYTVEDQQDDYIKSLDILFGATADFVSAEIDTETNTILEHYSVDTEIAGGEAEIIYGFDGETYELTQVTIDYAASEEDGDPMIVTSIGEPDETLLELPDLSSYTLQQ